mmetsp:Transcript_80060/g.179160  ORF Transcript_80060/g.179160 Transcript_80060/m.179160 type:complete len:133 (-) Transcript_80060:165-563(-)
MLFLGPFNGRGGRYDVYNPSDSEDTDDDDEFVDVHVIDVHFTQDSICPFFRNGQFAGNSVDSVRSMIEQGVIDVNDIEMAVFSHDGEYYTFNNRTLYVLKAASNISVVSAKLWNRPNNYASRLGHGKHIVVR